MISIELLVTQMPGLRHQGLERWIAWGWVRPDGVAGQYGFRAIDVARVRLIQDLRDEMQVNEEALPVVLSLLNQLHDMRRRMRELGNAVGRTVPGELRQSLVDELALG